MHFRKAKKLCLFFLRHKLHEHILALLPTSLLYIYFILIKPPMTQIKLLKDILLHIIKMDEFKTCTHCFNPLPIKTNFPEGKPKMDGTKTYLSWCCTCKYEYNLEYMRKRRTLIHTYIHTYYIRTYIQTDRQTYIHTYIHTCMHACIHTYIYMSMLAENSDFGPPSQPGAAQNSAES